MARRESAVVVPNNLENIDVSQVNEHLDQFFVEKNLLVNSFYISQGIFVSDRP